MQPVTRTGPHYNRLCDNKIRANRLTDARFLVGKKTYIYHNIVLYLTLVEHVRLSHLVVPNTVYTAIICHLHAIQVGR